MPLRHIQKLTDTIPVRELQPGRLAEIVEWPLEVYIGHLVEQTNDGSLRDRSAGGHWGQECFPSEQYRVRVLPKDTALVVTETGIELKDESIPVSMLRQGQQAKIVEWPDSPECIGMPVMWSANRLINLSTGDYWQNIPTPDHVRVKVLADGELFEVVGNQ